MTLTKIFVDTSFVVALVNERDQYHERAIKSADQYDGQALVVTDGVLLEVANTLARGYKAEAVQIIEDFLSAEDVEIVHMTIDLFNQALE